MRRRVGLRSSRIIPVVLLLVTLGFSFSAHGQSFGTCGAPAPEDFSAARLLKAPQILQMKISDNNRIFYITKSGQVHCYDIETGDHWQIGEFAVSDSGYMGLLSLALHPDFPDTPWIYFLYSSKPEPGLSTYTDFIVWRYPWNGSAIDMSLGKKIIAIPNRNVGQPPAGTHTGGKLTFGHGGLLFITSGDNSRFDSYGQLDDRTEEGTALYTSGNTNSLQGKILRIKPIPFYDWETPDPGPGKTYEIPSGNLFPPGMEKTRPEIYAMGIRNGYSIHVDEPTGWIMVGDVGPQGSKHNERGPAGGEELMLMTGPGNHGWPMFFGENKPYARYDYTSKVAGKKYDPQKPVNDSQWNTGIRELPLPLGATYTYYKNEDDPLGVGFTGPSGTSIAGPIYRFDHRAASPHRLPVQLDGKWLIADNVQQKTGYLVPAEDGSKVVEGGPLFRNLGLGTVIDLQLGPDGVLYSLDYGNGIARVSYNGDQKTPEECGIPMGCMNPDFLEYDPEARWDDGSCETSWEKYSALWDRVPFSGLSVARRKPLSPAANSPVKM